MAPVPTAPPGWTAVRVGDQVFFWPSSQPIPTSLDGSHGLSGAPNFRLPSSWDKQPPPEWHDLYGAANRGKDTNPFEVLATSPPPVPPAAPAAPALPAPAPDAPPFVRTGVQESGEVAKAIKEVNEKADKAQTQLAGADAGFMKAILGAHTRTQEGKAELSKIQKEWMDLSSKVDLSSPAGSKQMFHMMDNRMADINRILGSNVLDNASSAGIIAAKKALYEKIEPDGTAGTDQNNPQGGNQNTGGAAGSDTSGGGGGGNTDTTGGQTGGAGGGTQGEPVPPPPNLGGAGGADPLSGLLNSAGQIPSALGGALGAPLSSLGGVGSALGSALGPAFAQQPEGPDPYRDDSPGTHKHDEPDDPEPKKDDPEPKKDDPEPEPKTPAEPPAQPIAAAPPPPSDVVTDSDGKTTKAANTGLAKALDNVRNHGMDIPTGYHEAGYTVPPVTATIPPEQNVPPAKIMGGDLANTGTRWVTVWDKNTVLIDGQLHPISDLPNNGEMKGYWRPPETSGTTIATAGQAGAPPAQPASGQTSSTTTGK